MIIEKYEIFTPWSLPQTHDAQDYLDANDMNDDPLIQIHQGVALFPIDDAISGMTGHSFICPNLDEQVIEFLKLKNVLYDQPDHDPIMLYNSICEAFQVSPPPVAFYQTLSHLIQVHQPLREYIVERNLGGPNCYRDVFYISRVDILEHMKQLGETHIRFEFFFITKQV